MRNLLSFWKEEKVTGKEDLGIPEFSLGSVAYLGTYQWSHPLEEVDALPVIDVVRLPALREHAGRGISGTGPSPAPILSDGS